MTLGSDGDLYFGSTIESTNGTGGQGAISRITPSGQVTTFSIPSFGGQPLVSIVGMAAGSNGNMWFTLGNSNDVVRAATS
jgi:streptogramin lyase